MTTSMTEEFTEEFLDPDSILPNSISLSNSDGQLALFDKLSTNNNQNYLLTTQEILFGAAIAGGGMALLLTHSLPSFLALGYSLFVSSEQSHFCCVIGICNNNQPQNEFCGPCLQ